MGKLMKKIYPNWRAPVFRVLGRLHMALIVAICCCALFTMLSQEDIARELAALLPNLSKITPKIAYVRGLLFAIPLALSGYAIEYCKQIWQFVLCALALCGLTWLLLGHPVGALLLAVFCFFRARRRLLEEPGRSALDEPSPWGLIAFALTFVISALMTQPTLQRLSVLSAVAYLLILIAYRGLDRLDEYLRLNDAMFALPSVRIQRVAGGALLVALALSSVLLLPAAVQFRGETQLDLTYDRPDMTVTAPYETGETANNQQSLAELFEEGMGDYSSPLFHISPVVSYIVYALIISGIAGLLLYGVYRLLRGAGRSFTDRRDTVQFLDDRHADDDRAVTIRRERIGTLDRSPNAKVRRRYRKLIGQAIDEPCASHTPTQLEQEAGLSNAQLHALYERARYGQHPLTQEDVRSLRL